MKLKEILNERVSSKVLDPEQLEGRIVVYLQRRYDVDSDNIKVKQGPYDFDDEIYQYVTVEVPDEVVDKENWDKFFKPYGYYVADKMDDGWTDRHKLKLYRHETPEVDPPKYVYHYTSKNKLLKIKRKGLIPKKTSKIYSVDDPRIYLATKKRDPKYSDFKEKISSKFQDNPPFGREVAILKINTSKVDGKFYRDLEVRGEWSIFTRSNISPDAIINWQDFEEELKRLKDRE